MQTVNYSHLTSHISGLRPDLLGSWSCGDVQEDDGAGLRRSPSIRRQSQLGTCRISRYIDSAYTHRQLSNE